MLDDLIRDMKERGLMSIAPIRFIQHDGKAQPAFDMLAIMADTNPIDKKKLQGRLNQCQN